MDENFSPQPGRRVAFAWQFPPSTWATANATNDGERAHRNGLVQFPQPARAALNEELARNTAYNLGPDLAPALRPSNTATESRENTDPRNLFSLGTSASSTEPPAWPSWNAEPFSWPDRNDTHQAARYGDERRSALGFDFNNPNTWESNRPRNVPNIWDEESEHSWRDSEERPPSPNWNAEPPSWGTSTSRTCADGLHMASSRRQSRPLAFLDKSPRGRATLTFLNDDEELESIQAINLSIIRKRSAVLAMAFEESVSGPPQLFLETLTSTTAIPFLRYLYTGSYSQSDSDDEEVPTSVLFHFKMYHLGDIYDLQELKTQARLNVFRQSEYGCCSPDKPIDLCAAIRWFYQTLAKANGVSTSKHDELIDTVIDYCVTSFLRHDLGQDAEFKELAYELRAFHQALCSNIRDRNFDPNEVAAAIIKLPFRTYAPDTYASRDDVSAQRFDDVVFHFHAHDELDNACKKRKRIGQVPVDGEGSTELPIRPRVTFKENEQRKADRQYDDTVRGETSKRRASLSESSNPLAPSQEVSSTKAKPLPLRPQHQATPVAHCAPDLEAAKPHLLLKTWPSRPSKLPSNGDSAEETAMEEEAEPATDFESVPPPPQVEALSDSDSDDSFVEIKRKDVKAESSQAALSSADDSRREANDSDTDWELM